MSATVAGCGSSVGMNFGKEYYKMIVNAGYRGKVGGAAPKFTYTGTYNIRKDGVVELLTSGTIVFLEPKVIDVFMVGGGGAGNSGKNTDATTSQMGYGGGGGGYTRTVRAVNVAANSAISVTVGAGGVPFLAGGTDGNGGATAFGSAGSVDGGKGKASGASQTNRTSGNAGGSGGGGGVKSNSDYGTGGSNGDSGESGYPTSSLSGSGQSFTTREFGEATGKLYAGGGGGGRYMISNTPIISMGGAGGGGSGAWAGGSDELTQAAAAGVANTGGGGGGSAARTWNSKVPPASGGSGIVCFREAQALPELAGTWLLNERLYAPESTLFEVVNFTAGPSIGSNTKSYVGMSITPTLLTFLESKSSVYGDAIYKFQTNAWQTSKYKYVTFPAGTTASGEFRAWLASNASKQ